MNSELKNGLLNGIWFTSWTFAGFMMLGLVLLSVPSVNAGDNCPNDTVFYFGTFKCVAPSAFNSQTTEKIQDEIQTRAVMRHLDKLDDYDSVCYYENEKEICLYKISEFQIDVNTLRSYTGEIKYWELRNYDDCDSFFIFEKNGSVKRGNNCLTTTGHELNLPVKEFKLENYNNCNNPVERENAIDILNRLIKK